MVEIENKFIYKTIKSDMMRINAPRVSKSKSGAVKGGLNGKALEALQD